MCRIKPHERGFTKIRAHELFAGGGPKIGKAPSMG